MTILIVGGVCVLFVIGVIALMRAEDARDARRDPLGLPPPDYDTPLGPMPPEIAHEAPTRGVAQGRDVRVRALESRPAARAGMTGSLTPRPPMEDPGPLARGGPGLQTSPAALPASPPDANHTGSSPPTPGTAAAAGSGPPLPPPLPDPAWAAANPTAWPLTWIESDTFIGALNAIKDGA